MFRKLLNDWEILRLQKQLDKFLISACDTVLKSVKPFEEFDINFILKDFDYEKYYKVQRVSDAYYALYVSRPEIGTLRKYDIIVKFMKENGYIEHSGNESNKYLFKLTDPGRDAKMIMNSKAYGKIISAHKIASLKHPIFNYRLRIVTLLISIISAFGTIISVVYSKCKIDSMKEKVEQGKESVTEIQLELQKTNSNLKEHILIDSISKMKESPQSTNPKTKEQ